jgi:hypothetical protein
MYGGMESPMSNDKTNRRPAYSGPEIRTIPVSELLEMIGPAQGFSSGVVTPGDPVAYPTSFGPGTGGNINRN